MSEFTGEGVPGKATGWGKLSVAAAEFFGTATLLFIACLGAAVQGPGYMESALSSGLAVMCVIHIFGHISGAHVNPVTTICACIMGQIDMVLVPIYFGAQMCGAVAGFGLLKLILTRHFNTTHKIEIVASQTEGPGMGFSPNIQFSRSSSIEWHGAAMTLPIDEKTTDLEVFLVEMIITIILSLANCASWDTRTSHLKDSFALRFGFLVAVLNLIAIPISGCSMNPVRSFAPALWYNNWALQWIYWVAPVLGALVGSVMYRFLLYHPKLRKAL